MDQRQVGGIFVMGMDMGLGDIISLGCCIWGLVIDGVRGNHW